MPRDSSPTRVMIVDDSLVTRTVLARIVGAAPDLVVGARAGSAEAALDLLASDTPDVLLLDLDMPGMGGLEAMPRLLAAMRGGQVLVVSSLTARGAEATVKALAMGAADTLLKPRAGEFDEAYASTLVERIRALAPGRRDSSGSTRARIAPAIVPRSAPQAIAVGASTGGIHALCQLLEALPRSVDLPILVAQHLPESFMDTLARQLAQASGRSADVAQPGAPLVAGRIYVAPGGGHLVVSRQSGRLIAGLSHDEAPAGFRPSVDLLLDSVATATGGQAVGVVLSGMGRDGAIGAARLASLGGAVYAQDAASAAVWGMPRAVAESGVARAILPPASIAARIAETVAMARASEPA